MCCLYKGIRIPSSSPTPPLYLRPSNLELQHPSSHFSPQTTPSMSGAGGKWMVSFVMEEDITKLRGAGYLAANIVHHLPDAGQIIPTPEPHER